MGILLDIANFIFKLGFGLIMLWIGLIGVLVLVKVILQTIK